MLDLRDINKLQIDSYITIAAINSPNIIIAIVLLGIYENTFLWCANQCNVKV